MNAVATDNVFIWGTSSTRRRDYSGQREVETYAWEISLYKRDLSRLDWWCAKPENIRFKTIMSHTNAYCDLVPFISTSKKVKQGIHKARHEQGNKVRVRPCIELPFDPLPCHDPDTLVEYIAATGWLRIHYPSALRPFQHQMRKDSAYVKMFMGLRRDRLWQHQIAQRQAHVVSSVMQGKVTKLEVRA